MHAAAVTEANPYLASPMKRLRLLCAATLLFSTLHAELVQEAILPPPNTTSSLGPSVDVDGDTLAVTADGAVRVFHWNGSTWVQEATLPVVGKVKVSGDTLVVGVWNESVTSLAGTEVDEAGAIHVFNRTQGIWSETTVLLPPTPSYNAWFGMVLELDGDRLATIPGGGEGAAYLFQRSNGTWSLDQRVYASTFNHFSEALALSGETMVACGGGKAFIFQRGNSGWVETSILTPSGSPEPTAFGSAVAISGSDIAIGAASEVHEPVSSDTRDIGAVYVFRQGGTGWTQVQRLVPANATASYFYGWSLAFSRDRLFVGCIGYDITSNTDCGAVFSYLNDGNSWTHEPHGTSPVISSSVKQVNMTFGATVAASDDVFVAAGMGYDSAFVFRDDAWTPPVSLTLETYDDEVSPRDLQPTNIAIVNETTLSDGRHLFELRHELHNLTDGSWNNCGSVIKASASGIAFQPLRSTLRVSRGLTPGEIAIPSSSELLHVTVASADEAAVTALIESEQLFTVKAKIAGAVITSPAGAAVEGGRVTAVTPLPGGQKLIEFTANVRNTSASTFLQNVDLQVNPSATALTISNLAGGMSFPGALAEAGTAISTQTCFVITAGADAVAARAALLTGSPIQPTGSDLMKFGTDVRSFDTATATSFTPIGSSATPTEVTMVFNVSTSFLRSLQNGDIIANADSGEDYFERFVAFNPASSADLPRMLPMVVKNIVRNGAVTTVTGDRKSLEELADSGTFFGSSTTGYDGPARDPYNPPWDHTKTADEKAEAAADAAPIAAVNPLDGRLAALSGFSAMPFHFNDWEIVDGVTLSGQVMIHAVPLKFRVVKRQGLVKRIIMSTEIKATVNGVIEVGDVSSTANVTNDERDLFPPIVLPPIPIMGEALTVQPKITGKLVTNLSLPRSFTLPMQSSVTGKSQTIWESGEGFSTDPSHEFVPLHVTDPQLFEQLNADASIGVKFGAEMIIYPTKAIGIHVGASATPAISASLRPTQNPWLGGSADLLISGLLGLDLFGFNVAQEEPVIEDFNLATWGSTNPLAPLNPSPGREPVRPLTGAGNRWARTLAPPSPNEGTWDAATESWTIPFGEPGGMICFWKRGFMARLSAKGDLIWMRYGTTNSTFNPVAAFPLHDGTFTVLMSTGAAFGAANFDADGNRLWASMHKITGSRIFGATARWGGSAWEYFLVGDVGTPSDRDLLIVKLGSTGGMTWAKRYTLSGDHDTALCARVLADNHLLIGGLTHHLVNGAPRGASVALLMKITTDGTPIWSTGCGGSQFNDVTEAPDGSLYATGDAALLAGLFSREHPGAQVSRFSADGHLLGQVAFGGDPDVLGEFHAGLGATGLKIQWANGAIWVCGSDSRDSDPYSGWVARLNDKLGVTGFVHFGGQQDFQLGGLAALEDGIVVTGNSSCVVPWPTGGTNRPLVMKLPWEGVMRFRSDSSLWSKYVRPWGYNPAGQVTHTFNGQSHGQWNDAVITTVSATVDSVQAAPLLDPNPIFIAMERQDTSAIRSYSQWAYYHQLTAPDDTASMDFDGDGVTNGVESYFGLDPRAPSVRPEFSFRRVNVNGTDTLVCEFQRASYAENIFSPVQTSPDLINWSPPTTLSIMVGAESGGQETVWLYAPVPEQRRFYRMTK